MVEASDSETVGITEAVRARNRKHSEAVVNHVALQEFLARLKNAKISHVLSSDRWDAVSVEVYVPGEHWEVDFLFDGSIDVEIFRSDGNIFAEDRLEDLFAEFSD